jgi:hypothetical protein
MKSLNTNITTYYKNYYSELINQYIIDYAREYK